MAEKSDSKKYGASAIKVLEGLEAVRKRPAMYIGSTSIIGLHHLVYEVVDNSVDEALAGHCDKIDITLHTNGYCSVEDNGRGIPVGIHPKEKVSAAQVVMTKLHAGGKFDKDSYRYSGGLHGVGVSCVNALSKELDLTVFKDGKMYEQSYRIGKPTADLKETGTTDKQGTLVSFLPDPKIFDVVTFNFDTLAARIRELAFLNKGLRIKITSEITDQEEEFFFEGGIISFVEHINAKKNPLFPDVIAFTKDDGTHIIDFACQYNDGYSEQTFSFVNNIRTIDGGTHEAGFRSALTKACNKAAQKLKLLKSGALSSDDVREGLVCVLSIKIPEPQFEGQTKGKLGNSEIKGIVDSWIYAFLFTYFEENPTIARKIFQKAITAQSARAAAKKARELTRRKSVLESSILPGKLADCSEEAPSKCELYIVEGDSAGGCFCGETEVALLDGRNLSFKKLVAEYTKGIKHYCYTIDKDGFIAIAPIKHPRKTKTNVKVIKIVLDNDKEITCTPDHLFMMKDGSYKKAEDLTTDESLMPLYRKFSKIEKRITIEGYEMILDAKKRKWLFTHMLTDQLNLKNNKYLKIAGSHKHHIDFNKLNNNPENIVRMEPEAHMAFHRNMLQYTLHREDIKEKARQAHFTKEYREKVSKIMSTPKMKAMLSERAKKQWEDENYKKYMTEKFLEFYHSNDEYRAKNNKQLYENQLEYWSNPENRKKQSARVTEFFKQNPEQIELLSKLAKEQWDNPELLKWRSEQTKKQWTPAFREKRKKAYNETYYNHTIKILKEVHDEFQHFEQYETKRKTLNNKNLLKYDTFCKRFFDGDGNKLEEAVKNYNHKIKSIIKLNEKMDVYDIEVENTHNFALASGVFVHNSSKQGRDRFTQAVLPLKGKILNVEKARMDRILSNNEIKDLITAIGAGIGNQEFDADKVRYHKVIIMTDADVDGSHIRILLLTFFFRHMLPLIEHGYLYIAQPPLYKVKLGRSSRYLKDDSELNSFIFDWAKTNTTLSVTKKQYNEKDLGELLKQILVYGNEISKISNHVEVAIQHCHELAVFLHSIGWEKGKTTMQQVFDKLQKYFPKYEISGLREESLEEENAVEGEVPPVRPVLTFVQEKKTWDVPIKFFDSEETEYLISLFKPLSDIETKEWTFTAPGKTGTISDTGTLRLSNTIVKAGKSQMTIQRYKGLGEMNPEQLWETTMDPENRTLLLVTIEDALKADQWFASLMGDAVEDRKAFIEKHAHFVKNLDV